MNSQNLGRATLVALLTAALCVVPYAFIVKALDRNFSYLAIGVGLAVGFAAQKIGKASGIAVGIVAAVATFVASLVADCLAIKWILSDLGYDVSLNVARSALRPISYLIFAFGAFVAFGAAGGRHELRERSTTSGAGRFTPASMNPPPPTAPPAPPLLAQPQTWPPAGGYYEAPTYPPPAPAGGYEAPTFPPPGFPLSPHTPPPAAPDAQRPPA